MDRAPSTPVRMVSAVFVTCAVAASALTATYELTRDRIAEQDRAAERAALVAVLPDAEDFELVDELLDPAIAVTGKVPVSGVYRATDAAGDAAGWAVRVAPRGYAGPVQMIVGLDRDGLVSGVSIVTHRETPGLGTKILEPEFIGQFFGWKGADIEGSADGFDNIIGATKSAVAVRNGVIAAGTVYAEVITDASGEAETP